MISFHEFKFEVSSPRRSATSRHSSCAQMPLSLPISGNDRRRHPSTQRRTGRWGASPSSSSSSSPSLRSCAPPSSPRSRCATPCHTPPPLFLRLPPLRFGALLVPLSWLIAAISPSLAFSSRPRQPDLSLPTPCRERPSSVC